MDQATNLYIFTLGISMLGHIFVTEVSKYTYVYTLQLEQTRESFT